MLALLAEVDQALVTTTDWDDFTPELLAHVMQWRVEKGRLRGMNVWTPVSDRLRIRPHTEGSTRKAR